MLFAESKFADFPERIHAMTVKELRQGLRARKFVVPFIAVHIVMILACALEYFIVNQMASGSSTFGGVEDGVIRYGLIYWGVAYFMLLFVIPATRFFDLQQEFTGRNAELLLLSGLSRWQIVRGKWVFSVALSSLILVSILPYLLLRYFFGGFELVEHLLIALALVLNNAVFCAMVIGASAYRSYLGRIALIMAALVVLGFTMIPVTFFMVSMLEQPGMGRWLSPALFLNLVSASTFFTILGLQLARVKLRTFEDPYDPAPGSQVVILYLFAPLLIGIPGIFIPAVGSIIAAVFFTWIAINIDPPPKKGKRAFFAQH